VPRRITGWTLGGIRFPTHDSAPELNPPEHPVDADLSRLRLWAEEEVDFVLAELPPPLLEQAQRVPVTFEAAPNAALQRDGISPDTLGLFTGAEYAEEDHTTMPPHIILFLENLWYFSASDETSFRQEVRTTLLHELGHYLGLDEEDLTDRGLD